MSDCLATHLKFPRRSIASTLKLTLFSNFIGNEEMILFAWRTFSKWKAIDSYSEEAMRQQKKAYEFMVAFRETFSRPVRRIVRRPSRIWRFRELTHMIKRFLGLFDTVNSVRRFENAMMGRPHMPASTHQSHIVPTPPDHEQVHGQKFRQSNPPRRKHRRTPSKIPFRLNFRRRLSEKGDRRSKSKTHERETGSP